jgi:hypothetical protein
MLIICVCVCVCVCHKNALKPEDDLHNNLKYKSFVKNHILNINKVQSCKWPIKYEMLLKVKHHSLLLSPEN